MSVRWLPLVLFIGASAPGLLHAQTAVPTSPVDLERINRITSVKVTTNNDKMYEDIEILRRILDRKLTPLYIPETNSISGVGTNSIIFGEGVRLVTSEGNTGTFLYPPAGQNAGQPTNPYQHPSWSYNYITNTDATISSGSPLRSLEGVYLKGKGVVFTATLPSLKLPAKAKTDSSVDEPREAILKQNIEWESIRLQVRNENEKPKKTEASKPPSLSDVLLKVLAENGHHFSQLDENESLTIVVSVHETHAPSTNRKSGGGGSAGSAEAGTQVPKPGIVTDLELLGDLHQKQGHFEEALKAFGTTLREPGPSPKEERRLHRKMAQCYLALGNDQSARKSLDQSLNSARKEPADAKETPAHDAKSAAALPVKLIVSAPKKLLDQVKAGKISFEDFRHQASVETLRFDERR